LARGYLSTVQPTPFSALLSSSLTTAPRHLLGSPCSQSHRKIHTDTRMQHMSSKQDGLAASSLQAGFLMFSWPQPQLHIPFNPLPVSHTLSYGQPHAGSQLHLAPLLSEPSLDHSCQAKDSGHQPLVLSGDHQACGHQR
jgi:hypothetical protein